MLRAKRSSTSSMMIWRRSGWRRRRSTDFLLSTWNTYFGDFLIQEYVFVVYKKMQFWISHGRKNFIEKSRSRLEFRDQMTENLDLVSKPEIQWTKISISSRTLRFCEKISISSRGTRLKEAKSRSRLESQKRHLATLWLSLVMATASRNPSCLHTTCPGWMKMTFFMSKSIS